MRKFFSGRYKWFKIFSAFLFWPIFLGLVFIYYSYRIFKYTHSNVSSKPLRYTVYALFAIFYIPIILISFLTVDVASHPEKYPTKTPSQSVAGVQTASTSIPSKVPTAIPTISKDLYKVVKIVDGDTLTVNIDGKNETIRLIGIDTPEVVDPRKPVQCFGKEASQKAKDILTGKNIALEADLSQGDKDKYSRLLRYIFLEDGSNFNKMMIAEGYAHEYTYNLPYKYQKEFEKAEKDAMSGNRGLWNPTACVTPTPTKATVKSLQTLTSPTPTKYISSPTATPASTSNGGYSGSYSGDKDCKDFATQSQAQAYFNGKGGSASNNVDNLDSDHDGVVCESLQ